MEYPEWLDTELWSEFKQHRKELHKPFSSIAENRAIKKIWRLSQEQRVNPSDIIEQTLDNGWMGFFPLKEMYNVKPSTNCSATAEARRLQADGFRTGFEDEEDYQPALPPNVVNLR